MIISHFRWPQLPPLPPRHQPVLVRVAGPASRPAARQCLRGITRQILAAWSGLSSRQLPWQEAVRGPIWKGTLDGLALNMSFSYSDGAGWIGLLRDGLIGVDAMQARPFTEMEAVARLYLGSVAWLEIQTSPDPVRAFAGAWTHLEACTKCLRRDLTEWPGVHSAIASQCASDCIQVSDDTVVSVLTAPLNLVALIGQEGPDAEPLTIAI